MIRNVEPIITWRPWNLVAIKNVDPWLMPEMENGASKYSEVKDCGVESKQNCDQ